jgi:uncharacterized membrane protein
MSDKEQPPQPPSEEYAPPPGGNDFVAVSARLALLEERAALGSLTAEAQYRDLLISEIQQRINVRHWVIGIAMLVMVFMGGIITHAAHHYFWGPVVLIPASVAIVMFLAPVVSITTITVMLLIGAFRRFKDDDMDKVNVTSLAAEAVKAGQNL